MVCLSVHPSAYLAICNTIYLHLLILQLVVDEAGRLVLDLRGYGLRVRVWVRIGVRARVITQTYMVSVYFHTDLHVV